VAERIEDGDYRRAAFRAFDFAARRTAHAQDHVRRGRRLGGGGADFRSAAA